MTNENYHKVDVDLHLLGWVLGGCALFAANYLGHIAKDTGKIARQLQKPAVVELRTQDVVGEKAPEKFYMANGERAYLEIDGQPIEKYFNR